MALDHIVLVVMVAQALRSALGPSRLGFEPHFCVHQPSDFEQVIFPPECQNPHLQKEDKQSSFMIIKRQNTDIA